MTTTVFVRQLRIDALIGVHDHEKAAAQPLVADVDLTLHTPGWRSLEDTVNYERVVAHAREIAAAGHIGLVETFAHRLAVACLAEPHVASVRVRVEKPNALAPHASAAGVEITLSRE